MPLSANQQSFWFHSQNNHTADSAVLQVQIKIEGSLCLETLKQAWIQIQADFDMLRATVHNHEKHEALLICHEQVPLEFTTQNEISIDKHEKQASIQAFLDSDKQRGITLDQAPTSRLHCMELEKTKFLLVWTCHHLLLDGWSAALVINALFKNYAETVDETIPSKHLNPSFNTYRKRLDALSKDQSIDYWREKLSLITQPNLLGKKKSVIGEPISFIEQTVSLSENEIEDLQTFCKLQGLTQSTLVYGAWALLLENFCKTDYCCLGLVSTGRSTSILGSDMVVGNLANLIPFAIDMTHQGDWVDWLKQIQIGQFEIKEHDIVPYSTLMELGQASCRNGYFDSLIVVENLPSIELPSQLDLRMEEFKSDLTTTFPFNLVIRPHNKWEIVCRFDPESFNNTWITNVLALLKDTLRHLTHSEPGSLLQLKELTSKACIEHPNSSNNGIPSGINLRTKDMIRDMTGPRHLRDFEMLGLFGEVLLETPIDIDAGFFDLGGNSFTALKLISLIEKKYEHRLSVSTLLRKQTTRLLVDALETTSKPHLTIPSLIHLNNQEEQPGLFCLHAGGGHALFYRDFAHRLGNERPIYALQPRGIDGYDQPLESIESMAELYVDELCKQQPTGPYHLLGYCFGAASLLPEMSKLLLKRKKQIGHLIVVDSPSPIPRSHPMSSFGRKAYIRYERLAEKGLANRIRETFSPTSWNKYLDKAHKKFDDGFLKRYQNEPLNSTPSHLGMVQKACKKAEKKYRAEQMPFKISLITTVDYESRRGYSFLQGNWQKLTTGVDSYTVNATHADLFLEPHVREISNVVTNILKTDSTNISVI